MLSVQFGQNLLAETNGFKLVIDKKEDLSGLPEGVIAQAAAMAKSLENGWQMGIHTPGSKHDTIPSVF